MRDLTSFGMIDEELRTRSTNKVILKYGLALLNNNLHHDTQAEIMLYFILCVYKIATSACAVKKRLEAYKRLSNKPNYIKLGKDFPFNLHSSCNE
jgi:hypothetical protein